jgi:PTH1 family peptidyl-tRNA hydrolase
MSFIIAGLGNPEAEYAGTRHNTGRMMVEALAKKNSFPEFKEDIKLKARTSSGSVGKEKVLIIEPDNYMNRSGASLTTLVTSDKKAANLIVVHDDLDLPLGKIKISWNRSAGGHRGVQSIVKSIKTEAFIRVRVGISPSTPSGKMKKPIGEDAVTKHIIGPFKKPELETLKKVSKQVVAALEMIIEKGKDAAMGEFNR